VQWRVFQSRRSWRAASERLNHMPHGITEQQWMIHRGSSRPGGRKQIQTHLDSCVECRERQTAWIRGASAGGRGRSPAAQIAVSAPDTNRMYRRRWIGLPRSGRAPARTRRGHASLASALDPVFGPECAGGSGRRAGVVRGAGRNHCRFLRAFADASAQPPIAMRMAAGRFAGRAAVSLRIGSV